MIKFNGMIFNMGIKLFLVLSIHVFYTLMGFTDNHMHMNVFHEYVYSSIYINSFRTILRDMKN